MKYKEKGVKGPRLSRETERERERERKRKRERGGRERMAG